MVSAGKAQREPCLLAVRCSVYRWHDSNTGFVMEQEKQCFHVKGKAKRRPTRLIIPMENICGGLWRSSKEALVMRVEQRP